MTTSKLTLEDLSQTTRRKLGIRKPRTSTFSKDAVRTNALRVLAEISDLTQQQRARVLQHALRVNNV